MEAATPSRPYRYRWARDRFLPSREQGLALLGGALQAGLLLFWLHLLISTWGCSSLCMGSLACAGLIVVAGISFWSKPLPRTFRLGLLLLSLLITVSLPAWWTVWDRALAEVLGWSWLGLPLAMVFNGVLAGSVLLSSLRAGGSAETWQCSASWHGMAIGTGVFAFLLAPFVPTHALACVCLVSLMGLVYVLRERTLCVSMDLSASHVAEQGSSSNRQMFSNKQMLLATRLLVTAGLLPLVYRFLAQLQPETTLLMYGALAASFLGIGLSCTTTGSRRWGWGVIVLALVLAAFPLWLRGFLMVAALVSVLPLSFVLRLLGVMAFFAPAGYLLGTASRAFLVASTPRSSVSLGVSCLVCSLLILVGWSTVAVWIPFLGTSRLATLLLLSLLGVCYVEQRGNRGSLSRSRLAWGSGAVVGLLASVMILGTYQPDFAARTLFSTQIFQTWRNGKGLSQITGLDEVRLLAVRESATGTLTYWRHQGSHCQVRENGIPAGRLSENETLVPQPTAGILSAVLPLSLHAAPRGVLLLGLESGLGLKTILEFPVMQVECLEENQTLIDEAREGVLGGVMATSLADDRVRLYQADRHLALRRERTRYDVIIENPGHSAIYRSAARFEEAHYRWIAQRLADGGLYCQRFTFADYGPAVLRSVSETLQREFGYVTAFDTAPGEVLFVAARSIEDVFTAGFLERVSAPQTRRSLAKVGWDWSVVMNLSRFEPAQLAGVSSFGRLNAWQGTGVFRLTGEMMRWGQKWEAVRATLADNTQRLMESYAEEPRMEDVLRRLSDVAAREQVLARHPDQFWVYRKSVKKRLTDEPRTIIEPVKGEGLQKRLHPDDQRRLDYFETLGEATQQNPCRLESLGRVEEYAAPYDPMISYFLHPEIAKLYQRCDPPRPDLELKHCLHALYFGSQQERSVRGIHRGLELLAGAETSLASAERYDHINTLLELLEFRWQVRAGRQEIPPQVLMLDLKESLETSRQGLDALKSLGPEAGVSPAVTAIRIAELEQSLVRMLKSQRAELLARATRMPAGP